MSPREQNQKNKRNFLTPEQKKRVLDELSGDMSYSQVIDKVKFKVSKGQTASISMNRSKIESEFKNFGCLDVKRSLRCRHPEVEADVMKTVNWLREQRAPVTMFLILQLALQAASTHDFRDFKASRGWLKKFLRRNRVQASVRLHGTGGDVSPEHYTAEMDKIRQRLAQFLPSSIDNEDESGQFYRSLPNRTYLTQQESRRVARGTSQMKRKDRISVVFCTNSTGSHKLPITYIGRAQLSRCLRQRHDLRPRYHSQKNAWMDATTFKDWLKFWYEEIKKISHGPWLLLLDNRSGHKDLPVFDGVTCEFLPSQTTAILQRMDQGVISVSKRRYRTPFLRRALEIVSEFMKGQPCLANVETRLPGIKEGRLPHVADAIELMDHAWKDVTEPTVVNCWIKSFCLPTEHVLTLKHLLVESENARYEKKMNLLNADVEQVIGKYYDIDLNVVPDTPLSDVARDVFFESPQRALQLLALSVPQEDCLQDTFNEQELCNLLEENQEDQIEQDIPAPVPAPPFTNVKTTLERVLEDAFNLGYSVDHIRNAIRKIDDLKEGRNC